MDNKKARVKRISRLGAFTLNFFFPPAGYVYVGRTMLGIVVLGCILALLTAAFFASIAYPPGLFWIIGDPGLNASIAIIAIGAGLGAHAAWLASHPKAATQSRAHFWIALLGLPLCIHALSFIWKAYFPIPTYIISSDSGLPTLAKGDQVAALGARARCGSPTPKLGTLIVLKSGTSEYVKRVIAGQGDTVELKQGRLILNGAPVIEQVVGSAPIDPSTEGSEMGQIVVETLPNQSTYRTLVAARFPELDNFGPYKVPPHSWFVLGDNRDNSLDSRSGGAIDQKQVCGVLLKIVNSQVGGHIGQQLGS